MDRRVLPWLCLILVGGALLATVPPDAQYVVNVDERTSVADDREVTAVANLSAENAAWFREARNGTVRIAVGGPREPPDFGRLYVADGNTVYEMRQSVISGNVLAIYQPWAGVLSILFGVAGAGLHYRYDRLARRLAQSRR